MSSHRQNLYQVESEIVLNFILSKRMLMKATVAYDKTTSGDLL